MHFHSYLITLSNSHFSAIFPNLHNDMQCLQFMVLLKINFYENLVLLSLLTFSFRGKTGQLWWQTEKIIGQTDNYVLGLDVFHFYFTRITFFLNNNRKNKQKTRLNSLKIAFEIKNGWILNKIQLHLIQDSIHILNCWI